MNELRRATRKTIVQNVVIRHARRGDFFFPPDFLLKGENEVDEVWVATTTYRTGLLPSEISYIYFLSEDEAIGYKETNLAGTEILEPEKSKTWDSETIRKIMDSGFAFGIAAGDRESPLAMDVLGDAGIYRQRYGPISSEVVDFLGEERVLELRQLFGENWQSAAAFEFCWLNLPHSSPAFVAASYQYHYYITEDDFSAGYHWRDLEIMIHGVEAEALKAIATRQKAGKSGSEKSAQARAKRRADLFIKMEAFVARSPDVIKFGADGVAKVASEECANENPTLWSQGRGQVGEYLGEIRRGEAGQDMQKRYEALFGSKPPRRF